MSGVLVFDAAADVTRVTQGVESDVLVFDVPAPRAVQEQAENDFLLFDAPPPDVTLVSQPQSFLLIDVPQVPLVKDFDTGKDVLVITSGGPPGPPGPSGGDPDVQDLTLVFENGLI